VSYPINKRIEGLQMYKHGVPQAEIARKLGVKKGTVWQWVQKQKLDATFGQADIGFYVTNKSVLYDEDGEKKMEWIKTKKSLEGSEQIIEEILLGMEKSIPKASKTKAPKISREASDRMNVYVFGDSHVNMLSWKPETGADWDIDIALERHLAAMKDLIHRAPKAEVGILALMGDLLHGDSLKPTTFHGTDVDVDGRLGKGWDGITVMTRGMVEEMLTKYKKVIVLFLRGNHSPTLELVFSKSITLLYEKEPRVEVLDNTNKHIPYVWESNFLLFTHGDKLNAQKKANIAVGAYRDLHGAAKFTHVLSGHLHHTRQEELSGALVEIFPVLPTPDAWHCEAGFVTSDQSATVLSYHKGGGITERTISFPRIDMRT